MNTGQHSGMQSLLAETRLNRRAITTQTPGSAANLGLQFIVYISDYSSSSDKCNVSAVLFNSISVRHSIKFIHFYFVTHSEPQYYYCCLLQFGFRGFEFPGVMGGTFRKTYRCFTVSFMEGKDRTEVENGGKSRQLCRSWRNLIKCSFFCCMYFIHTDFFA